MRRGQSSQNLRRGIRTTAGQGGILDDAILNAEQIKVLADLPSKEVLQAKLLGLLLAPATKLVRVLNEPASSLARVLKAKAEAAS